jgi:hypothetical protein
MALILAYNEIFDSITKLIGTASNGAVENSSSSGNSSSSSSSGNSSSAPTATDSAKENAPLKSGPITIWNHGAWRKNVDDFGPHHSSHKKVTFKLKGKDGKDDKTRVVTYRKSGWAPLFQKYLSSDDWKKYNSDNSNTKHVVYDMTLFQNGSSQPVGIMAPFDCKVVEVFGNPNSGLLMVGTGDDKGKTAIFLHVVPSTKNKSTKKQFGNNVLEKLKEETLNKTFKKGELMAYQGNWGEHSTGTHLHIEAMTKEDFDDYITNLPSYYEGESSSKSTNESSSKSSKSDKKEVLKTVKGSFLADNGDELHAFQSTSGRVIGGMQTKVNAALREVYDNEKVNPMITDIRITIDSKNLKTSWEVDISKSNNGAAYVGLVTVGSAGGRVGANDTTTANTDKRALGQVDAMKTWNSGATGYKTALDFKNTEEGGIYIRQLFYQYRLLKKYPDYK